MKEFLKKLVSNENVVSSNRVIGITLVIFFMVVVVMGLLLFKDDEFAPTIFEFCLKYIFILIIMALSFKGVEKVIEFIFKK